MAEIAREAGVTRGLLHHYFGTKRELYLAVVADLATELPDLVRRDLGDLPVERWSTPTSPRGWTRSSATASSGCALLGVEAVGRDPEVEAIMAAARDEVVERMAANQAGRAADRGAAARAARVPRRAEAAAREWALRGRATREQVHAVLLRARCWRWSARCFPTIPRS